MSKYGVFAGPYFPAFEHKTERYRVSLRIQSKCGKIGTRRNFLFGYFLPGVFRIFPYSVGMRENTDQKKLRIWTLFMQSCYSLTHFFQCYLIILLEILNKNKKLFNVFMGIEKEHRYEGAFWFGFLNYLISSQVLYP